MLASLIGRTNISIQENIPAALTKDKKRIHGHEIAVHLAWKSTLYVTNFPPSMDDSGMRTLFGKVRALLHCSLYFINGNSDSVRNPV